MGTEKIWESSKTNEHNIFVPYLFIQSKNDPKLQMAKLLTAIKFHDIIGMLATHLNQEEVDTMVKNNKLTFQDFRDTSLIPSQTRVIMPSLSDMKISLAPHSL